MMDEAREGGAKHEDGAAGVQAWIAGVKPEHRSFVKRIDALIAEQVPGVKRAIKWRKPSLPLGVCRSKAGSRPCGR